MSVFKKQALIATSPAFNVFERQANGDGYVNITADDILALDSGRGFYRTYSPGSVVSYALEYNECPIAAVEDAKAQGHALHWINARGVAITAHKRPPEDVVLVKLGMKVLFEGLLATIESAPNSNLRFVPVAGAAL